MRIKHDNARSYECYPQIENRFQYLLEGEIGTDALRTFLTFIRNEVPDCCAGIDVMIHSRGGSVPVALAFAELLLSLPCEVRTCNLSNVDSASIIVFSAGEKRLAPKGATFFLHPVGKEVSGVKNAEELRQLANEIDHDTIRETEFLSQRTGTDSRVWQEMMAKRTLINDSTALRLGLVTTCGSVEIRPSSLVVKSKG